MKPFLLIGLIMATTTCALENGLKGSAFLQGIKDIISRDNNVPREQIEYKPFVGSFTNLEPSDNLENVSYCMTDDACGQSDAYSKRDVPLDLLGCNDFCYIEDEEPRSYSRSQIYTTDYPPEIYLNCGWETCG